MGKSGAGELVLIRHAPALSEGRLCGRTDVSADLEEVAQLAQVREAVGPVDSLAVSPALRCRQTATALWPDKADPPTDPRLWEQDFGAWEGVAYKDLPDLGARSTAELASHRPPNGESFEDMCTRVHPALRELSGGGRTVIVAHAGTVRAALALALDNTAAALRFEVDPLSVSKFVCLPGGGFSVRMCNWSAV